jgi:hypothetical protein
MEVDDRLRPGNRPQETGNWESCLQFAGWTSYTHAIGSRSVINWDTQTGEGDMDEPRPIVLVCSADGNWRASVAEALAARKCHVIEKAGEPEHDDLTRPAENVHPPDVVLWRFDGSHPMADSPSLWLTRTRSAAGTQFVLVRFRRGVIPLWYWMTHEPRRVWSIIKFRARNPFGRRAGAPRILGPRATISQIADAVGEAVSKCWRRELFELDVPACQITPAGRILRANPAMAQGFGDALVGKLFRSVVENAPDDEIPAHHPIARVRATRHAVCDFVETIHGHSQLICMPDIVRDDALKTLNVLIPETGNRAKVFRFARQECLKDPQGIYEYIVKCALELGYRRVRLYQFDKASSRFRGVAAAGFRSPKRQQHFVERFFMPLHKDEPSADTVSSRLPAVCIHDPNGTWSARPSPFVRVYRKTKRNFVKQLELENATRWIDAPLVVPGTQQVLGKLVVDDDDRSDRLSVRDALDVGYLAMMAAGALHAYYQAEHSKELTERTERLGELTRQLVQNRAKLERYGGILQTVIETLPRIALVRDDLAFFRAIAAILSCEPGLRWEQVFLFIVDPEGLRQAKCVMALGGHSDNERLLLGTKFTCLYDYVDDALRCPEAHGDRLYEAWVDKPSDHQVLRFGSQPASASAVGRLLAGGSKKPYEPIHTETDSWCQSINDSSAEPLLTAKRLFAFPLPQSYALDIEMNQEAQPTQPVGAAFVGMASPDREIDELNLLFTSVCLDFFGPLISQRWTSRRLRGMFGSLSAFFHTNLNDPWNRLRHASDEWTRESESPDARKAYETAMENLGRRIREVTIAQATLKNLHRKGDEELELKSFLNSRAENWNREWSEDDGFLRLRVDAASDLRVRCDPLVLGDAMTCILRNAVDVAKERGRGTVSVTIEARSYRIGDRWLVEITMTDDAGGVDEQLVPYLFLQGVSGRTGGKGRGLALARAELLMYSGDLQYDREQSPDGGATFRILFFGGKTGVKTAV